jgi:hypothetical protein
MVTIVPPAVVPPSGSRPVIVGLGASVVLVVLVVVELVLVELVEVVEVEDVVELEVVVDVPPGDVVDVVVVVVGFVGSGAMTTGSPLRIRTYSLTVISGVHVPCLQTST